MIVLVISLITLIIGNGLIMSVEEDKRFRVSRVMNTKHVAKGCEYWRVVFGEVLKSCGLVMIYVIIFYILCCNFNN